MQSVVPVERKAPWPVPESGGRFAIEPLEERIAPSTYVLNLGSLNIAMDGTLANVHLHFKDVALTGPDGGVVMIDKLNLHFHDAPAPTDAGALQNVHLVLKDVDLLGPPGTVSLNIELTAPLDNVHVTLNDVHLIVQDNIT